MNWDRSQTIALAKTTCTHCHGYGLRRGRNDREVPCNCVFRAIFRACYARFRDCVAGDRHLSRVRLEFCNGKDNRVTYGRKVEEYIADFCLVSRNALSPLEYDIFRFHYLLGAEWKLCCWRLQIDRGNFFHILYKIEQKLGRVFRELEPHSLFPLDEYFGGTMSNERFCRAVAIVPKRKPPRVLRPPVGLSAA
ncbi:MAG TPA: hypothetical protein VN924_26080 [Bryobacteraceae bacterium]|jgi:hypothetical protein|nr:hypothetical protein [Bryobacteraceae bacterium]